MMGRAGRGIGFVGLVAMRRPMAADLVAAGLPLTVLDSRAEMVASGASSAPSLPERAIRCDVVGVCVVDNDHVMEIVAAELGLLPALRPGSAVVLQRTIQPDTAGEVHVRCGEQ